MIWSRFFRGDSSRPNDLNAIFVQTQKLTPVLKNYVLNAIAMAPAGASTRQGLKRYVTLADMNHPWNVKMRILSKSL